MGVGHTAGTRKDELVELSSKDDEAAAVPPRRPFAAQTPSAENIICFLAVLGSLYRRRKFNRARTPFSGRVCKSCFRLRTFPRLWNVDNMSGGLPDNENIL